MSENLSNLLKQNQMIFLDKWIWSLNNKSFQKKYSDELQKIPMSGNTTNKRITAISTDLIFKIKDGPTFAIQLDETTGTTKLYTSVIVSMKTFKNICYFALPLGKKN